RASPLTFPTRRSSDLGAVDDRRRLGPVVDPGVLEAGLQHAEGSARGEEDRDVAEGERGLLPVLGLVGPAFPDRRGDDAGDVGGLGPVALLVLRRVGGTVLGRPVDLAAE